MKLQGKARVVGDNVNTDQMYPTRYTSITDEKEMGKHCMEDYDATLLTRMERGDILVAGVGFGCGSSREHAPKSIKAAGFSCILAKGFSRIFYRNAINNGLPIIICAEAVDDCKEGDELMADFDQGVLINERLGKKYDIAPFPSFVQKIMDNGGLIGRIKTEIRG